jgi:hypothetical protein
VAVDDFAIAGILRNEGRALAAPKANPGEAGVATEPVSFLRKISGEVILVISGQRRMMYQSLEPKHGGNNLF